MKVNLRLGVFFQGRISYRKTNGALFILALGTWVRSQPWFPFSAKLAWGFAGQVPSLQRLAAGGNLAPDDARHLPVATGCPLICVCFFFYCFEGRGERLCLFLLFFFFVCVCVFFFLGGGGGGVSEGGGGEGGIAWTLRVYVAAKSPKQPIPEMKEVAK